MNIHIIFLKERNFLVIYILIILLIFNLSKGGYCLTYPFTQQAKCPSCHDSSEY